MRSGTSYFDLTIYKKTVARFWPLWAAYFVLWLILLPLEGFLYLRMDARDKLANYLSSFSYMENYANEMVPQRVQASLVLAVIVGVLAAMAVFSHLYNARSANLFGSLPIRREGLFLSHYLAGLSFTIVPNVVIFLLTLLVEAAGGCVSMKGLLFWLAVTCGECFFFYSTAVFCAMFTGHILALPAFYGIFNIFAYGVTGLFYTVLNGFYYGFAGFSPWVEDVVRWLTPTNALSMHVRSYLDYPPNTTVENIDSQTRVLMTYGWGTVGIYVLAGLVLAACAFLLYRARHLESAGDVVAVKPMRPVFKYGVALCVGMVFGVGTSFMLGGGEVPLMAAILIWGVVGYFAAQMLLDKSFRVFKKWKGAVAVAGVFVALFLVVGFDLTGYETRIPDAADVKSVEVRGLEAVRFCDNGDDIWLTIEDPKQIELFVALHRAAVEERYDRDDRWRNTGYTVDSRYASASLHLEYTLKNGSTLKRWYDITMDPAEIDQEGTSAWAMEQLYHMPELYWRVYMLDVLEAEIADGGRLDTAQFVWYDDERGSIGNVIGYGDDARSLLDAVEEDLLAGRIGVRTLADTESFYVYMPLDCLQFRVEDPADGGYRKSVSIALQDTAASTLAELKRLAEEKESQSLETPLVVAELRERGWLK